MLNRRRLRRALRPLGFFSILFLCATAFGAPPTSLARIKQILNERFPDIVVEKVEPTPWPGLFTVLTADEIVYTDQNAERLFIGKIIDAKSREDLTAKRWQESLRIDFNSLPFAKAIKVVYGNGSRKVAIFEDPQCPYCQRLEKALHEMTDVTLYVFLFPLKELHPGAEKIARDIWCSDDRAAAWTAWMTEKVAPQPTQSCTQDPIADIQALSDKLNVNATPTLFFVDGDRTSNAMTREQLESTLNERIAARHEARNEVP